jgi:carbon monoxide dehydrogenase subunit G
MADLILLTTPAEDYFYDPAPPWQAWPGSVTAKNQEYQWRVTTKAGVTSGLLSAFTVAVDVPDKLLALNAVAISAGGSRLTGAIGQFNLIQNIQLTLQGGSTAVLLEIQDYSVTLGPLITAKNSAGTSVTATIDALLQGY